MNQENVISIISICYGLTLIGIGFLIKYYKEELQRLINYNNKLEKSLDDLSKIKDKSLEEMILRGDKILRLVNSMNILKNQNIRYSKICRKLYDENQNLQEKIAELEKGKLKEKRGKK